MSFDKIYDNTANFTDFDGCRVGVSAFPSTAAHDETLVIAPFGNSVTSLEGDDLRELRRLCDVALKGDEEVEALGPLSDWVDTPPGLRDTDGEALAACTRSTPGFDWSDRAADEIVNIGTSSISGVVLTAPQVRGLIAELQRALDDA